MIEAVLLMRRKKPISEDAKTDRDTDKQKRPEIDPLKHENKGSKEIVESEDEEVI
jgi:hypothetical protein